MTVPLEVVACGSGIVVIVVLLAVLHIPLSLKEWALQMAFNWVLVI